MGTATGIKKQEDEKVGSGNNNNIGSTAKRIRAGFISNQDAALLHLPPLPKRPSSIATTLIPPSQAALPAAWQGSLEKIETEWRACDHITHLSA